MNDCDAHTSLICDRTCKKGSYTCNSKYQFEILNAVYLESAQRVFHAILHQSTVTQGNSFGILFIGLLAELPSILDSFSPIPCDYIGVVGSHEVAGKNTRQVVTPPYGPIGAVDT